MEEISILIQSYELGRMIRDGVALVLTGPPNAGKSSLLNGLLRERGAIVTEDPGTTRDVISENISIGGILFHVSDTAGIRASKDPIEKEGVRRSLERLEHAEISLLVL